MPFKVIETQEELDAIIGARLKREGEKHAEEIAALKSKHEAEIAEFSSLKDKITETDALIEGLKTQKNEANAKISDLELEIKGYETKEVKQRIATECGIPLNLIDRIKGETEDEIKEDAIQMAQFLRPVAPMAGKQELGSDDDKTTAYKDMLKSMFE